MKAKLLFHDVLFLQGHSFFNSSRVVYSRKVMLDVDTINFQI